MKLSPIVLLIFCTVLFFVLGDESANLVEEEEQVSLDNNIDESNNDETSSSSSSTNNNVDESNGDETSLSSSTTTTTDTEEKESSSSEDQQQKEQQQEKEKEESSSSDNAPIQSGPMIDLFGPTLLKLNMIDETHAQLEQVLTNDALRDKKVIGLYFSADWCGPCRQFTPDLVSFYNKMNKRRGKENTFEIIWISRCRDIDSFGQYFTHMNWLALPPDLAMGEYGQQLANKYKVKGIPHLALLDEVGSVITYEGRTKIPMDKTGVGFPWRNPLSNIYMIILPKALRLMIKNQIEQVQTNIVSNLKRIFSLKKKKAGATA